MLQNSMIFTFCYSRITLSYFRYFQSYFPMQNLEKMVPRISSVEIWPVISPR